MSSGGEYGKPKTCPWYNWGTTKDGPGGAGNTEFRGLTTNEEWL